MCKTSTTSASGVLCFWRAPEAEVVLVLPRVCFCRIGRISGVCFRILIDRSLAVAELIPACALVHPGHADLKHGIRARDRSAREPPELLAVEHVVMTGNMW